MTKTPGRPRSASNVRAHLEYVQLVVDLYEKHGDCPLFRDEMKKLSLYNKGIIAAHDKQREQGNRHDLCIGQV